MKLRNLLKITAGSLSVTALAGIAHAADFNVPAGDLKGALDTYANQSGVALIVSSDEVRGAHTKGVKGDLTADAALSRILVGTGFSVFKYSTGAVGIAREDQRPEIVRQVDLAQTASAKAAAGIESVVVTSSKIKGDIQTVPIAITALSQEQLTSRQIAGGPDLVKEVPNLTFSKTNFTGYNIQIRGIGTQAISVTTDPAVAVAFNDMPFIRNHFFEQEFYDLSQAEVLRGPQGTLYGRNATAGVVNLISAKPTDQFEAMASADIGNYHNRRFEGMVNIPIVDDRADLRIAGEWTKRDGYSFNQLTNAPIDGRDLWSSRVTLGFKPAENLQAYLIWEHFQESDDRMRTSKQLCKTAPNPATVDGVQLTGHYIGVAAYDAVYYASQGCEASSLYSPDAFEVPNGLSLPYGSAIGVIVPGIRQLFDPYASTVQSQNLRVIESSLNPIYRAKNDTLEFNADYNVTPALTVTSQTGYNNDSLWSSEDYNRFNTAPGIFFYAPQGLPTWQLNTLTPDPSGLSHCQGDLDDTNPAITEPGACHGLHAGDPCSPGGVREQCNLDGVFCDPQVGCSSRLVAQDLSDEKAWQFSQEFRLASNFNGPLNFSVGGNYLHYETEENYYVFINTLTYYTTQAGSGSGADTLPSETAQWIPGVSDNSQCLIGGFADVNPFAPHSPTSAECPYIDPNPLTKLNNQGHNYFLSQNPYTLNSYAAFGEAYYNVLSDLKLTAGLRWTDDEKHFVDIPSELLVPGYGYPATGVVNQKWNQWTGRGVANWTPKLDFTDQTLIYGSYAHGYKAGGANPPGATLLTFQPGDIGNPIHPLTFKPEFVDAFELGTKNTLFDGALTLNGDIFYYNYKNYQISRIVDRTAINDNFNAHIKGAEVETTWEPAPGLKLNFAGGYEDARAAKGDHSVDLMDRTAGHPGWIVVKPFITQASNCVLPDYVVAALLFNAGYGISRECGDAYASHLDPVTTQPYVAYPTYLFGDGGPPPFVYPGFDPLAGTPGDPYHGQNTGDFCVQNCNGTGTPVYNLVDYGPAPNNGQGFDKDLSGNQLPNAPHFTTSFSAEYTMPVSEDWAATLHGDFYWQSQSYARIFNDRPYDKLRGYSTANLALILTSASGWQVMAYLKNVFNKTAITGDFLNSDDSGLTTNVFLTDPRLFGVRVTKNW
ncbi:MAG TPA: TonB-dependent receptor [Rhizomicrobium sp.]|nr:TonB-dependent receptor [Rhizomicrobium sp.]